MLPYKDIQQTILKTLQSKGPFKLADVAPYHDEYQNSGPVYANNCGMGLIKSLGEGKYFGEVLFTLAQQPEQTYHKCGLLVAIPPAIADSIQKAEEMYRGLYSVADMALKKAILEVKESAKGSLYLLLKPCDYEITPGFEPAWKTVTNKGNTVLEMVDGRIKATSGVTEHQKFIISLWGDDEVYDTGIVIPPTGNITFRNNTYLTLASLVADMATVPSVMRVYNDMPYTIYKHRLETIQEVLFDQDFRKEEPEFLSEDEMLKIATKILKTMAPPAVPKPTGFGAFKLNSNK